MGRGGLGGGTMQVAAYGLQVPRFQAWQDALDAACDAGDVAAVVQMHREDAGLGARAVVRELTKRGWIEALRAVLRANGAQGFWSPTYAHALLSWCANTPAIFALLRDEAGVAPPPRLLFDAIVLWHVRTEMLDAMAFLLANGFAKWQGDELQTVARICDKETIEAALALGAPWGLDARASVMKSSLFEIEGRFWAQKLKEDEERRVGNARLALGGVNDKDRPELLRQVIEMCETNRDPCARAAKCFTLDTLRMVHEELGAPITQRTLARATSSEKFDYALRRAIESRGAPEVWSWTSAFRKAAGREWGLESMEAAIARGAAPALMPDAVRQRAEMEHGDAAGVVLARASEEVGRMHAAATKLQEAWLRRIYAPGTGSAYAKGACAWESKNRA